MCAGSSTRGQLQGPLHPCLAPLSVSDDYMSETVAPRPQLLSRHRSAAAFLSGWLRHACGRLMHPLPHPPLTECSTGR